MAGSKIDNRGLSPVSLAQPGSNTSAERLHEPLNSLHVSQGHASSRPPTSNHASEDTSRTVASRTDTSAQVEQSATGRIARKEPQSLVSSREAPNIGLATAKPSSSFKNNVRRHKQTRSESGSQRRMTPGRSNNDLRRTLSAIEPGIARRNGEELKANSPSNDHSLPDYLTRKGRILAMPLYDETVLQHQLIANLERDFSTSKDFMPRRVLDKIIHQESVNAELNKYEYLPRRIRHRTWRKTLYVRIGTSEQREITGSVTTQVTPKPGVLAYYQLIFSILTYMGRSRKIWSFVSEGICDQCLPLVKEVGSGSQVEFRKQNDNKGLKCLKKLKDVDEFVRIQWYFIVPRFGQIRDGRIVHCEASDRQILPFIEWRDKGRRGAFGSVYQAKVHVDHHGFDSSSAPGGVVAVKKLVTENQAMFEKEWKTLRNLQKVNHRHDHLIPFLGTFEQNDCYYLILPWAEADLENYWMRQYSMPDGNDEKVLSWMLKQIQGLAEAVSRIHRYDTLSGSSMLDGVSFSTKVYSPFPGPSPMGQSGEDHLKNLYGRHGDIKPANILWFPGGSEKRFDGVLRISDFGTTCFTSGDKVSLDERKSVPDKGTYQPPECQFPTGILSSQCDVWSLGCVFLEFICWFMGGAQYLRIFEQRRRRGFESDRFFTVHPTELTAHVKKPVHDMIRELESDERCNSALRDLLKIIEIKMLVVNNETLGTVVEQDEGGNAKTSTHLQVQQPSWLHRRKSSGNVARDVGDILQNLNRHENERGPLEPLVTNTLHRPRSLSKQEGFTSSL